MTDPSGDRYPCFRAPLAHPRQSLAVEYVREAPWDQHWAIVFNGVTCRQELRRMASYPDARATVTALAGRITQREGA